MPDPTSPPSPLEELMELHGRTTDGIWEHGDLTFSSGKHDFVRAVSCNIVRDPLDANRTFVLFRGNEHCSKPEDAEFVAIAHNILPAVAEMVAEKQREIIEREAEIASLKDTIRYIDQHYAAKMRPIFSFGPERVKARIRQALDSEDHGHALAIADHLRDTLHRLACYPRMTLEEMVAMAHAAISWKPQEKSP